MKLGILRFAEVNLTMPLRLDQINELNQVIIYGSGRNGN